MKIITENINELSLMFNEYLENYLEDISLVKMNFFRYGFNSRNLSFYIHYDGNKLNSRNFYNNSIYYGVLEKEDFQVYFFGSDLEFNQKINPPLAVSLNVNNLKKSCVVFGKDNDNNIYLLMRIKFDNLRKHEQLVLKRYNNIEEIDGEYYINFGCFDSQIQILRNIRNFVQKIDVVKSDYNLINMNSIIVPQQYIKMEGLPEDYNESAKNIFDIEKNNYCMICGHKIRLNNQFNKYLSKYMSQNPNKCYECFLKILISYFQSKVGGNITNKTLFLSLVKNKKLIEFYINLLEFFGVIDNFGKICFREDLSEYEIFYSDIPKELLITENLFEKNEFLSEIYNKIDSIEKLTIHRAVFNGKFKKLLSDYKLFPTDGHLIKNKLIEDVKKGELDKDIEEKIMDYIIKFAHEKKYTNIFELSNKLNNLTLKNQNELNDTFKNKLTEHFLNEDDGWEIRNQLIIEIDNLSISSVGELESRFNCLFNKNDKKLEFQKINDNNVDLIKEFLIIKQNCKLNAIVKNTDLNSIFQLINDLKSYISLNSIVISKISKNQSKFEISFRIENENVKLISNILLDNNFQNLLKGDNHER